MNTLTLHLKLNSIIHSASTKTNGDLLALGASIYSAQLREETGVDIGSWDSEISESFHKYSIVHSLHNRIESEIEMLRQADDLESIEYLESEMLRPDFFIKPVSQSPTPDLEVFYKYPMGLTRTAEEAVIACGDSPLSHALALTITMIADKLGAPSDQNELFLLDGPAVIELPGTVCKRAIALKVQQRHEQAVYELSQYISPVNR